MSNTAVPQRTEQSIGNAEFLENPCKKFLTFKNIYTMEETVIKGKKKEIKVFDSVAFTYATKEDDEWVNHTVDLPLEFAILNGNWISFKGWNDTDKCMYYSNEVNNADQQIHVRNKEEVVYSFTLNQLWGKTPGSKVKDEALAKTTKGKLAALNVKQHSSIYVALRNDDNSFELANFQLKGANLSGSSNETLEYPTGWWNVNKQLQKSKTLYSHYHQFNDFITESGELGEYGIVNWSLGDRIQDADNDSIQELFSELHIYHQAYLLKNTDKVDSSVEEAEYADELPWKE